MKIIFYIIVLFLMFSCKSKLYKIYERQIETKEEYILVKKEEISKAISQKNNLFYIGSDSQFHYFKIYNTSLPAKFCLKFKLNKEGLNISEKRFDSNLSFVVKDEIFK